MALPFGLHDLIGHMVIVIMVVRKDYKEFLANSYRRVIFWSRRVLKQDHVVLCVVAHGCKPSTL